MKNKLLHIIIVVLSILLLMPIAVFGNTLLLNISTKKEKVKVGDEITIKVSWNEGMQAADFYLNYDAKKLEYRGANIADDYIHNEEGRVKTAWFSMDDTDKQEIEYTFKVKKSGTAEFSTQINGGFATGELKTPNQYQEAKASIKIKGSLFLNILKLFVMIIIIIIIIKILERIRKKSRMRIKR